MILYSIWITDADGQNGRWIIDSKRSEHVWAGPEGEALIQAERRRRAHGKQYRYEVKRYATKSDGFRPT